MGGPFVRSDTSVRSWRGRRAPSSRLERRLWRELFASKHARLLRQRRMSSNLDAVTDARSEVSDCVMPTLCRFRPTTRSSSSPLARPISCSTSTDRCSAKTSRLCATQVVDRSSRCEQRVRCASGRRSEDGRAGLPGETRLTSGTGGRNSCATINCRSFSPGSQSSSKG